MNYLMLVNKDNPLDNEFIPSNLVEVLSKYKDDIKINDECYKNFLLMQDDAKKYGYDIDIMSGYRD